MDSKKLLLKSLSSILSKNRYMQMRNLMRAVTTFDGSTHKNLINNVKKIQEKAIIVDNILQTLLQEAQYAIRPYA